MKKRSVWPWVLVGIVVLLIILVAIFGGFFSSGQAIKANSVVLGPAYVQTGVKDVLCEQTYLSFSAIKLRIGDPINGLKSMLTDMELPGLLEDGSFLGNVDAEDTQTIKIGNNTIKNDTGVPYIRMSTSASNPLYTHVVTFSKAVNFASNYSIGEWIKIMGQDFVVGLDTTASDLVLYRSAQQVDLSIGGFYPKQRVVNVENTIYVITLISATDTSATIRVFSNTTLLDETKEIAGGTSKKVGGLDVAVISADVSEVDSSMTVKLWLSPQRYELTNGAEVKVGSDENVIDGTNVVVSPSGTWASVTSFSINFFAPDSDHDEIVVGQTWANPVFKNLKLIFESYDNSNGAMIKLGGCAWDKPCIDSDGGDVPFKKGTLTYYLSNFIDSCNSASSLSEYYCTPNNPVVASYNCAYGCSNGACASAPASSPSCSYNIKTGKWACA